MSRSFTASQISKIGSSHVRLISLVKLEFSAPTGTLRLHNGLGQYTIDGQIWYGTGDLGNISQIEEGQNISPYGVTLSLSSIDSDIANEVLQENYYQRPVTIYVAILDESDQIVDDPVEVWAGHIDQIKLTSGNQNGDVVQVVCESELALFDRSRSQMFTNVWQQQRSDHVNPDRFFDLVHLIDGVKVNWKGEKTFIGGIDAKTTAPGRDVNIPQF